MGFSSKAISVELMKKLSSLSYFAYQSYCRQILAEILPHTEASKEMRELDSEGIDLFLLNDANNGLEYAFQCKGFEVSHFGEKQLKQCVSSIRSLRKIDFSIEKYYLIVNRTIYGEERKTIESELDEIIAIGNIKHCELLDAQAFIEFLYKIIRKNFQDAIKRSNDELYNQYKRNLDQRFYYANVPFEFNERNIQRNPSKYLREEFQISEDERKSTLADFERNKYFFVIGDFGFGKTSLMFQSITSLNEHNAIYLPLSFFRKRDIQNQLEFVMVINKLVTGEENDIKNLFVKFKSRVLANVLDNDPRIILLFDGMDENLYLGTVEGLKILFSVLNEVKAKCVFSMRKTFWEERNGNFQTAIPKSRIHKDRIRLIDWNNEEILEYIDLYKRYHSLDEKALNYLNEFEKLVREDNYSKFYGDIPKRPLFLEMIIQDVIDGNIKEVYLSELYEKYFFRKFVWDNESLFDKVPQGRPTTFKGDIYKGFSDIVKITEAVAGLMIKYDDDDNEAELESSISEEKIIFLIKEKNIDSLNAFLLNSVISTVSERTINGVRLKFAHRSYQDYFTARFIYREVFDYSEDLDTILNTEFPKEVVSFLVDYCKWKNRTNDILNERPFVEALNHYWVKDSLGYHLTISFKDH